MIKNMLHMALDTNIIKLVVRMFDSMCANVVRSLAQNYDLWHELTTLGTSYTAHCSCCWFNM